MGEWGEAVGVAAEAVAGAEGVVAAGAVAEVLGAGGVTGVFSVSVSDSVSIRARRAAARAMARQRRTMASSMRRLKAWKRPSSQMYWL